MTSPETTTMTLPCRLTDDERRARGDEMAAVLGELQSAEDKKATAARMYGELIKEHRAKLTELAREIRTGLTDKEVQCMEIPDYNRGLMNLVRMDTGETVRRRDMSDSDRQLSLVEDQQRTQATAGSRRVVTMTPRKQDDGSADVRSGVGADEVPQLDDDGKLLF